MTFRKVLMGAALAALSCGSVAWGADQSSVTSDAAIAPTPDVYYMDASSPTTLTPFNYWMSGNSVGKWMAANNLSFGGFVEGGYFYDTNAPKQAGNAHPGGDSPTLINFPGLYSNRGQLDQADAMFQKTIDSTKSWDWGFQIEQGYGTDFAGIHSNGLVDNRNGVDPDNQYDIVQANVSLLVPLGSGLTIKAGKFVALFGEEYINPTENAFFTHTYSFFYGIPATNTGVLLSYTFPKLINGNDMTVTAGITRGWNQSLRDQNGEIDFEGELSGKITDKLGYTFNMSEGPEGGPGTAFPGSGPGAQTGGGGDSSDYWTLLELIPTYQISDQLSASADLVWGDAPHSATVASTGHPSAQWFSAAPYLSYKWSPNFTFNLRGEWYRDQGGLTVPNANAPISANYYAVTFGVQIHPLPNDNIFQWLELRPEVRYDLSDRPVFNASHSSALSGVGDYNEFTAAMDVIMQF